MRAGRHDIHDSLDDALAAIAALGPLDDRAMSDVQTVLDGLTKPPGSLGRLEEIATALSGITGLVRPSVERRAIVVAAADHGVTRQGVSAYPAEVTAQMVAQLRPRRGGDQCARPDGGCVGDGGRRRGRWASRRRDRRPARRRLPGR